MHVPAPSLPSLALRVACLLVIAGCGDAGKLQPVAWVDHEPVSVEELEAELERRADGAEVRFATGAERRAALDALIERRMLVLEARERDLDEDPGVRRALEDALIERIRAGALERRASELVVQESDVREAYERELERYTVPERVHVALIWIPVPEGASEPERRRLHERARLSWREASELGRGSSTFGAVAVRYSADPASRYRGGDIGWLERGDRDPRFGDALTRAAFALESPGDLSSVIETGAGFAIAKLVRRRDARTVPFEEVREQIRAELEQERRRRVLTELVREVSGRVVVRRDESLLDELPLFAPVEARRE